MSLFPFFKNGQVVGGRCSTCLEETPSDFRKPEDTDETTVHKAMAWYEEHECE
jgi:hypothetical protein